MSIPQDPASDSERKAFEAQTQVVAPAISLHRRDMAGSERFGQYVDETVEFAWQLWQACTSLAATRLELVKRKAGEVSPHSDVVMWADIRADWNRRASLAASPQAPGIDPMQDPMRPVSFLGDTVDETPAEQVLRKLACWLGVGGYNAPTVDAELFHEKIVCGINYLLDGASPQALPDALPQALGASPSATACSVASLPEPEVSALRVPPAGAEEFVRMLLWDEFPECCGRPVVGAEYMGQQEQVCCGDPEAALLNDAQIVASLRERFPQTPSGEGSTT